MRVSREKAAQNRAALLDAAGRLFRERGIDDVGVADIGKEAGLTHGALYAHFESKEALAAEAFRRAMDDSLSMVRAAIAKPSYEAYVKLLLSERMRDTLVGCPMAASTSEVSRQGEALSASFADGFTKQVALIEESLLELPPAERRRIAVTMVAAEIGALAVSRAVAKSDPALSNEVLKATRITLERAHQPAAKKRAAKKR